MPIEINIYVFILKEQALQKLKYMLFEWENWEHACQNLPTGSLLLYLLLLLFAARLAMMQIPV